MIVAPLQGSQVDLYARVHMHFLERHMEPCMEKRVRHKHTHEKHQADLLYSLPGTFSRLFYNSRVPRSKKTLLFYKTMRTNEDTSGHVRTFIQRNNSWIQKDVSDSFRFTSPETEVGECSRWTRSAPGRVFTPVKVHLGVYLTQIRELGLPNPTLIVGFT